MLIDEWYRELDRAQERVLELTLAALSGVGMSEQGLAYVKGMRGYPRTPYYMALWVMDPQVRRELGVAICIHAIGIKLIDDLIDDDQKLGPQDLIFGVYLLQVAEAGLSRFQCPPEVFALFERDYQKFWRYEVRDAHAHPASMVDWLTNSRIKAGQFLATYAEAACLAGGAVPSISPARAFAEAFGLLYMMGDDWTDYTEAGQEGGNLAHLLATGKVSLDEVMEEIQRLQASAKDAIRIGGPVCCDITPKIEHFAAKIAALFRQVPGAADAGA